MAFTAEQIEEIKKIFNEMPLNKQQRDYISARFMSKCDCDAINSEYRDKLSSDYAKMAVINTKLNVIIGVLAAVGTAMCGVVVKMMF